VALIARTAKSLLSSIRGGGVLITRFSPSFSPSPLHRFRTWLVSIVFPPATFFSYLVPTLPVPSTAARSWDWGPCPNQHDRRTSLSGGESHHPSPASAPVPRTPSALAQRLPGVPSPLGGGPRSTTACDAGREACAAANPRADSAAPFQGEPSPWRPCRSVRGVDMGERRTPRPGLPESGGNPPVPHHLASPSLRRGERGPPVLLFEPFLRGPR